ncbi:hypothetical protein ACFL1N_12170 [Thermodesulfobacteriota bacterium]
MGMKISRSGLVEKTNLTLKKDGIVFYQSGAISGSKKKFKFHEIDYILISKDNNLSFQVGNEVFTVKVNPDNKKHNLAIEHLIEATKQTV